MIIYNDKTQSYVDLKIIDCKTGKDLSLDFVHILGGFKSGEFHRDSASKQDVYQCTQIAKWVKYAQDFQKHL